MQRCPMGTFVARIRAAVRSDGSHGPADRLVRALDAVGEADELDVFTGPVRRAVKALPLGPVRDVLHGRPFGHPLHPALVHVSLGAWVSASVLDLAGGSERQARLLVGFGTVAAAPTAWSGWVDWAEQHDPQLRTGLVHAASMATAAGLYGTSWAARSLGRHSLGRALGFAGLAVAGAGAAVGGHVAHRQAAVANKAEPVPFTVGPGWHPLGPLTGIPVGEPCRRTVGEVPVVVVREADGAVHVLADRCSHRSGPLSDGTVADGCLRCPWHGSTFRLSDGWNVRGPATAPQPRFDTRTDPDGTLYARLPQAD